MSNRRVVTDHIVVRWLQRAEGLDIKMVRAAMERDGLRPDHDGEVLHFIETNLGVDVAGIRSTLQALCYPAVKMGAKGIKHKGYFIKIHDGVAVTVVPVGKRTARILS